MKVFASAAAVTLLASLLAPGVASAADEAAARELARANNCFKCHAMNKDKDGPSFNSVAEKNKGKADAESKIVKHLTSGEMSKFPDGHEEKHKVIVTDPANDMAQIKNLAQWLLSLK
jgi:cytochrome c